MEGFVAQLRLWPLLGVERLAAVAVAVAAAAVRHLWAAAAKSGQAAAPLTACPHWVESTVAEPSSRAAAHWWPQSVGESIRKSLVAAGECYP